MAPGPRAGAARAALAGAGPQCRGIRGAGPVASWWPRGGAGRAGHVPAGPLRLPRREGGGGGDAGAALSLASVGDMDVCPAVAWACSFPFSRVC